MALLDGLTNWLTAPFQKIWSFCEFIWNFVTKWIVGLLKSVFTLVIAFIGLIPAIFTSLSTLIDNLGSALDAWQPLNIAGMFSGAPGFSLAAINQIVPLQEILSGLLVIVTLVVALVSKKIVQFS